MILEVIIVEEDKNWSEQHGRQMLRMKAVGERFHITADEYAIFRASTPVRP